MLDTSTIDGETGGASTNGYSYAAQYGVRRASTRDVFRTQFGSLSADEYLSPVIQSNQRNDGNVARRLSRNSFLIPPQTFVHRSPDGMCNEIVCFASVTSQLSLCMIERLYER